LFISGHNLETLQDIAIKGRSGLFTTAVSTAASKGLPLNVLLINGQSKPTMSITSHVWHRFRMVFGAVEAQLYVQIVGSATCTMNLLAKDGIYLDTIPRSITKFKLYPGHRSDVAVSCTCSTYPCTGTLRSAPGENIRNRDELAVLGADLMTLTIFETVGGTVPALPTVQLARPCYLVDLQHAPVPVGNTASLRLGSKTVFWDGQGQKMTYKAVKAAGGMRSWPPLTTLNIGTFYEINVQGVHQHPLHTHVNPFQITSMPATSYEGGYFKVGDWHDTLLIDELGSGSTSMKVRMPVDQFTGKLVIHCHILKHEDKGMMAYANVAGAEGSQWSGAKDVDETCYTGAYKSSMAVSTIPTLVSARAEKASTLTAAWTVAPTSAAWTGAPTLSSSTLILSFFIFGKTWNSR
jgi:hypothetical protein